MEQSSQKWKAQMRIDRGYKSSSIPPVFILPISLFLDCPSWFKIWQNAAVIFLTSSKYAPWTEPYSARWGFWGDEMDTGFNWRYKRDMQILKTDSDAVHSYESIGIHSNGVITLQHAVFCPPQMILSRHMSSVHVRRWLRQGNPHIFGNSRKPYFFLSDFYRGRYLLGEEPKVGEFRS